jgi:polar amino acid transport system permease protein
MFSYCKTPADLDGLVWLSCYLTTNTHFSFYWSFVTVLLIVGITAPIAVIFGFGGALAKRSRFAPLRWFGNIYSNMVRGVPEIIFFLFVPIALDQAFEYVRFLSLCADTSMPVYQGNDFVVCDEAKLPLSSADAWVHKTYSFFLAVLSFSIVFGAFASNVIDGALKSVPKAQLETAIAYGLTRQQVLWRVHVPQMWGYALAGLSNLWMILIKSTPLIFLLGIEDIVYWAGFLGASKTSFYEYPHPDWRLWYFLALLVFYLLMTFFSEKAIGRLSQRLALGQATLGSDEDKAFVR